MNYFKKLYSRTKCFIPNNEGAALVLVAMFLLVIFGFTAIVVDAGMLYKTRRQMVTAADAAALAGARELKLSSGNTVAAEDKAEEYAVLNGADYCVVQPILQPTATTMQVVDVTVHRNVDFTFARILGFTNKEVTANAVATWGFFTESSYILPFFYEGEGAPAPGPGVLHVKDGKNGSNWGIFELQGHDVEGSQITKNEAWDMLAGDVVEFDPPIYVDDPDVNFTEEYEDDVDEYVDPGFVDAIVPHLVNDNGTNWDAWGRLYKYHQMTYHAYPNSTTLYGLVPVVTVDHDAPSHAGLIINGFAIYEIQDVIVAGNTHMGSIYSTFAGDTHTAVDYSSQVTADTPYEEATIIGRFVADGWIETPVSGGDVDQTSYDPNSAKYLRLIK